MDSLEINYFADILWKSPSGHKFENKNESLGEHSKKVLEIFNEISKFYGISQQVKESVGRKFELKLEEKEVFWKGILLMVFYHDIGKINPYFIEKCSNKEPLGDSSHSFYSFLVLLILFRYFLDKENTNHKTINKEKLLDLFTLFSLCVYGHHTGLKNLSKVYEKINSLFIKQNNNNHYEEVIIFNKIKKILSLHSKSSDLRNYLNINNKDLFKPILNVMNIYNKINDCNRYNVFFEIKLIYSLLIISDFLAASEFEYKTSLYKENYLTQKMIDELIKNYEIIVSKKSKKSKIGQIRNRFKEILLQRIRKIDLNKKRVFYMYLPTGAGKTYTSFRLALEIAKLKHKKRIFYVFPFINLIEQNIKELSKIAKDNIFGIYSYSDPFINNNKYKENENSEIDYTINLINELFYNYPIIAISNVSFFDTFIKPNKKPNYRLNKFHNSVIIIDEIQSLTDKHWVLFGKVLSEAAKNLNAHIIVMSATLPNLSNLLNEYENTHVLCDPNDEIFKKDFQYFNQRVKYCFQDGTIDEVIKNNIFDWMKRYKKILIVVNDIETSQNLYEYIKEISIENRKTFLLNSTILYPKRIEVLESLKKYEIWTLISTQTIEAGMNIDADLGIREAAPIESIIQIGGRVNREIEKKDTHVIISTQTIKGDIVYKNSLRGRFTFKNNKKINPEIINIIKKINDEPYLYNRYIEKIFEKIKSQMKSSLFSSQKNELNAMTCLKFSDLEKIDVIGKENFNCFIEISVTLPKEFKIGNSSIKDLLERFNIDYNIYKKDDDYYLQIDGKKIENKFFELISLEDIKPNMKKIKLKQFLPLFRIFLISITSWKFQKIIENYGIYKYGIFFIKPTKDIYSYEKGLIKYNINDNDVAVIT